MSFNFMGDSTKYLAVGFVVISALVMGYILYELEATKRYFANQLIAQTSDRVEKELDQFFLPLENLMLTLKEQDRIKFFEEVSVKKLNQYYIPVINQYPQISSVGIANNRGYEINILPDSTGTNWLNREIDIEEWGKIEKWRSWEDKDGLIETDSWTSEFKEDPRNRPWYSGTLENSESQIHWTEPYLYLTNNKAGLTASIKLNSNEDGTLTNILALDVTLEDITEFSQGLSITENNQIVILTQNKNNIVGLPQKDEDLNPEGIMDKLFSTPEEFGNQALITLLEFPKNEVVSFKSEGETWWGVLNTFDINETEGLQIAVMIPESDFASDITTTERAIIGGFLVIFLLASLLVRSHNRLSKAKASLNEQNEVITEQKGRLFAEVHHRVKNNLAIMSALMELENMESDNVAVQDVLTQTQRRIKSMSAVHEIMYKTDDVNKVQITEFIPGIINFSKKDFDDKDVKLDIRVHEVLINVNQALTYALLLNEFMSSILKAKLEMDESVIIQVVQEENKMVTKIKIDVDTDFLKEKKGIGKQLIQVLMAQLKADLNTHMHGNHTTYEISFKLEDKKGITSNYNHN